MPKERRKRSQTPLPLMVWSMIWTKRSVLSIIRYSSMILNLRDQSMKNLVAATKSSKLMVKRLTLLSLISRSMVYAIRLHLKVIRTIFMEENSKLFLARRRTRFNSKIVRMEKLKDRSIPTRMASAISWRKARSNSTSRSRLQRQPLEKLLEQSLVH